MGIASKYIVKPFFWPTKLNRIQRLTDILSPDVGDPSIIDTLNMTKRYNLEHLFREFVPGADIIAELGASYPKKREGASPCLTATRTGDGAYWSLLRCRPLRMQELMALQGFRESDLPSWRNHMSERQMGTLLGNAMTLTVMTRVMRSVLGSLGWKVVDDEP